MSITESIDADSRSQSSAPSASALIHAFGLESRQLMPGWFRGIKWTVFALGMAALLGAVALMMHVHFSRRFSIIDDLSISAVVLMAIGIAQLVVAAILSMPRKRLFLIPLDSHDPVAGEIARAHEGQGINFAALVDLAHYMARQHAGHLAVTTNGQPHLLEVVPLNTPIQPRDVRDLSKSWLAQVADVRVQSTPPARNSFFVRRLVGYALLVAIVVATGYSVLRTISNIRMGTTILTSSDYRLVFFAGIAIVFAAGVTVLARRRQCFACSAGLISRSASVFSPRWNVDLFEARKSGVLAAWISETRGWILLIASGGRELQLILDQERLQVLLSCWFSPVLPPGPDQVSDFA